MYRTIQDIIDTLPTGTEFQIAPEARYSGPGKRHRVHWIDVDGNSFRDRFITVWESSSGEFAVMSGSDVTPRATSQRLAVEYAKSLQGATFAKLLDGDTWDDNTNSLTVSAVHLDGSVGKYLVTEGQAGSFSHMRLSVSTELKP